ncbi:MAG: hypothetical protein ACLFUB_00840 [Cyclobacteriaceae bacterium]
MKFNIEKDGISPLHARIMHSLRSISLSQWLLLSVILGTAVSTTGCKARKEARAAAEARAERVSEARAALLAIINDNGNMSLEEKESELRRVKLMNLDDAEIRDLIARAEAVIAREKEEAEKLRAERDENAGKGSGAAMDKESQLQNIFQQVASARSASEANYQIRDALSMFASPQTPVLIMISNTGGQMDYDEPTTIQKYLEYLKDTNNTPARIHNLVYDANGKIKEVELLKNYTR